MKAEQLIHTSCRRGFKDTDLSSGFNNYSYSEGFSEILANSPNVMSSVNYERPRGLPVLPTATEKEAFPHRYCFFPYSKGGLYVMALNTYIGADYTEGSARGGNFLGHITVSNMSDVRENPGLFVGSKEFIHSISRDMVASENKPAPLPVINLTPNPKMSPDVLRDIVINNRKVFSAMLAGLISISDRPSAKLIIRDTNENICAYASALLQSVPLGFAKTLSVSTYEYEPENSDYKIVGAFGVLPQSSMHLCFDMENGSTPNSATTSLMKEYADFVTDAYISGFDKLSVFSLSSTSGSPSLRDYTNCRRHTRAIKYLPNPTVLKQH